MTQLFTFAITVHSMLNMHLSGFFNLTSNLSYYNFITVIFFRVSLGFPYLNSYNEMTENQG